MDMKSSSSGPDGFKSFYSERPRSQGGKALSPLVTKQMEILTTDGSPTEEDM